MSYSRIFNANISQCGLNMTALKQSEEIRALINQSGFYEGRYYLERLLVTAHTHMPLRVTWA